MYGLLSPFAGYLADRFGRVRVIVFSLMVWSVVTWMTAHAANISQLLATRALMGVSEAFYLPAALALIVEAHGERSRSLATGIHQSGLYTGMVLGGAWGGWMGEHYGWRPVFTILGGVGVGYMLLLWLFLRPAAPLCVVARAADRSARLCQAGSGVHDLRRLELDRLHLAATLSLRTFRHEPDRARDSQPRSTFRRRAMPGLSPADGSQTTTAAPAAAAVC